MITSNNVLEYELPSTKYCRHCGRKNNLKTIFVKSANRTMDLTYCDDCWDLVIECLKKRGK